MSKSKGTGVAGLLGAVAKKPSAANKSSTPTTKVTPALAPALKSFVEAQRAMKAAEARKKDASAKLLDFAHDERVRISRKDGSAHSSIKLTTDDGDAQATYISQSRCKNMPVDECENEIRAVFGADFDSYFRIVPQISISDEITDDQATKLAKALESAGLIDLVQVAPLVKPTEKFYSDVVLDPEVAAKTEKLQKDNLVIITNYLR